jgi:dihydroxyacetone kinase-like protein
MQYFLNTEGVDIIKYIIASIKLNRDYLSKIDGEIGDGDHGINMSKGFTIAGIRIEENNCQNFSDAAKILSQVLMMEIGGSMGPLYGTLFKNFHKETNDYEKITSTIFLKMLESALNGVIGIGKAKVGDKTMIDTLFPAVIGFKEGIENNFNFKDSLNVLLEYAQKGRDSTKEMVAKIGRSARLGNRSMGILDAGAVSCFIILESMSNSICSILNME